MGGAKEGQPLRLMYLICSYGTSREQIIFRILKICSKINGFISLFALD
jgi:hypothetical protein